MKKIKASEILKMNPILTLDTLKGYKYYAVDSDNIASLYRHEPYAVATYWEGGSCFDVGEVKNVSNWRRSLREIDFATNEELIEIEFEKSDEGFPDELFAPKIQLP